MPRFAFFGLYSSWMNWLGSVLPRPTPIRPPMAFFSISFGPHTLQATVSNSRARPFARRAISVGVSTLLGSLTRSRLKLTPAARARPRATRARTPRALAASSAQKLTRPSRGGRLSLSFVMCRPGS